MEKFNSINIILRTAVVGIIIILALFGAGQVFFNWPAGLSLPNIQNPNLPPLGNDIARELRECMPKSDMASRDKCQRLLATINSFQDCAKAGLPVMESYPERCQTPDGRSFTKSYPPADVPQKVTIHGQLACLPHKDTGGPVTLECAYGLKDGPDYYALDNSALPPNKIFSIPTGREIEVIGLMVPIEQISSNSWKTYDIRGIIKVDSLTQL